MKNELKGFSKVFAFTFVQAIKGKAVIVSTLMLVLLSVVLFPLMKKLTQTESTSVETVVFLNETDYELKDLESCIKELKGYEKVKVSVTNQTKEEAVNHFEEGKDTKKKVLLLLSMQDGQFYLEFIKNKDGGISDTAMEMFSKNVMMAFQTALALDCGVSKEQLTYLQSTVNTEVKYIEEVVNPKEQESEAGNERLILSSTEYNIFFMLLFLSMMFIMLSGESIATSIVTEKSTRVIEYLMISVRPMAIIVGKVFAMLLVMLIQIGVSVLAAAGSSMVLRGDTDASMTQMLKDVAPSLGENLNLVSVFLSLIFLILGFLFYSFIAGLAGAAVSKLEEVAEGMKIYSMAMLIGAYLAMFLGIMSQNTAPSPALKYVAVFLPLSSAFCVPEFLMMGKISLGLALASLLVLLVCLVLLAYFVSKVYESMILHRGEPIKLKDIIRMGSTKKKAVKE